MNNIYLLYNFNNYFNRQVKRYATLAEYKTAVNNNFISVPNVINFTPNDGIDTKQIFNVTALNVAAGTPDYMLVVDDSDVIQSRWFVIDTERTRAQQYIFHLYRDTIAEAWEQLQSAPVFVEKGILAQSDPMILNPENMTFNQIKKSERMLKDETYTAWIVGYMTQDNVTTENQSFVPDSVADATYTALSDYPYNTYTVTDFPYDVITPSYRVSYKYTALLAKSIIFNDTMAGEGTGNPMTGFTERPEGQYYAFRDYLKNGYETITDALRTNLGINQAASMAFDRQNDKLIYISSTNKFYRVSTYQTDSQRTNWKVTQGDTGLFAAFETAVDNANDKFHYLEGTANGETYDYSTIIRKKRIRLTEVPANVQVNYKVSNTRARLTDQPYSMFCMPYGYIGIDGAGTSLIKDWKEISLQVAKNICLNYGGSNPVLYDLQILPYCPIRQWFNPDSEHIDITDADEDKDYSLIIQNNITIGYIFWATKSTASFDITYIDSIADYKTDNETRMMRICSPNYAGQFEFSPAKNGGITAFNIDFTYKPYNPYIHINPVFGKLYGSNFRDARGLICGGKFDMPQTTDAWASYERSNSNYNNIFNRQIENLEITQQTQRIGEITGMVSGAVSAGIIGGMAGGAAGAIGSFGLSAAAGIADIALSERLRSETMDYTKDMYGFRLGNIKAMPDSLVSVGAMTNNNKIFPFLEVYKATDAEIEALKNKIRFNGMTVGKIGNISEFASNTWTYSNGWNYFKGKLIRLELGGEDWHFVNTIKAELDRGIFIKEA